jgi:hypothetical protein
MVHGFLTRRPVIGLIALLALSPGLRAEEGVPAELQAAIMTRMLGYDRALKSRAGDSLVIGVLAKAQDRASVQAQAELAKALMALQSERVQGLPLAVVTAEYKDDRDLATWLSQKKVLVLYVAPGLSKELDGIRGVCEARKVMSITPVQDFVRRGLVAGIILKDDRPRIVVNLPVAIAAGLDLDSKLLALSEVIR